ncbi:MAG TPA: hypothetical protein VKW76_16940 [Candidatus Binatia bacterium]|nr:hypothetical protein [Candidatus Binatia bacterium]
MRPIALLGLALLVLCAGRHPAAAQAPCAAGTLVKLSLTPQRQHLRVTATFVPPAGFDPATQGLSITVAFEPDDDPANVFYTVTVPGTLFTQVPHAIRFVSHDGGMDGLKFVRLSDVPGSAGLMRIQMARRGTALANTMRDGVVGVVVGSGDACVRACIPCVGSTPTFSCKSTGSGTCGG